jgi:hypothetical protein
MKCPHCQTAFADAFTTVAIMTDAGATDRIGNIASPQAVWQAQSQRCPSCFEAIIFLVQLRPERRNYLAFPLGKTRPIPAEVPEPYRQDFKESVSVLSFSPKASAAISRRLLQMILREHAGTTKKDLYDQIEEIITSNKVPPYISDDLHAVRNIGNIAAHAMKSTNTGEIVDVEPGEAEWNLDGLESLFEFYFVAPARSAKRAAALHEKLKDIGKAPKS